jgi:hypothetical protein
MFAIAYSDSEAVRDVNVHANDCADFVMAFATLKFTTEWG